MKKYCIWIGAVILLGIAFCFLTGEPNSPNKTFTLPQWKVGDWWKVRLYRCWLYRSGVPVKVYRNPETAADISFEIKAIKEYKEEQCYEVEIRCENEEALKEKDIGSDFIGRVFICYFRQEDYTCKGILQIPIKDGERGEPKEVSRDPEGDFVASYQSIPYLPVNISKFFNANETKTVWQSKDGKRSIIRKVEFDGPKARVEFSRLRTKEEHPRITKCTQVWETGKPWWSESRETALIWEKTSSEEGEYVEHEYFFAELIDWKGKQKDK